MRMHVNELTSDFVQGAPLCLPAAAARGPRPVV